MVTLAPDDMERLRGLRGYDLTLAIAEMSTKYGIAKNEILAMLTQNAHPGYNSSGEYDPSPKSFSNPATSNLENKLFRCSFNGRRFPSLSKRGRFLFCP